ncbi:hypothetical protein BDN72DRAFT_897040, partial [Pluteus cervinus]
MPRNPGQAQTDEFADRRRSTRIANKATTSAASADTPSTAGPSTSGLPSTHNRRETAGSSSRRSASSEAPSPQSLEATTAASLPPSTPSPPATNVTTLPHTNPTTPPQQRPPTGEPPRKRAVRTLPTNTDVHTMDSAATTQGYTDVDELATQVKLELKHASYDGGVAFSKRAFADLVSDKEIKSFLVRSDLYDSDVSRWKDIPTGVTEEKTLYNPISAILTSILKDFGLENRQVKKTFNKFIHHHTEE